MKIYTRKGDEGSTGLRGGGRVSKHDVRVAAYGDVDELNSVIGVALATEPVDLAQDMLLEIQRNLFAIGGQLASAEPAAVARALEKATLASDSVTQLEVAIDRFDEELIPLRDFVLPGGTAKAATLHLARTVCRRAERSVVALSQTAPVQADILAYLNRLSDVFFTLARLANRRANYSDTAW